MKRQIIKIDEDKCNGCGVCVSACHEGAIRMIDGKAKLIRDDYCDGLGNCLPACPTGAITFEEREAAAYDEEAVKKNMEREAAKAAFTPIAAASPAAKPVVCGCPGTAAREFARRTETSSAKTEAQPHNPDGNGSAIRERQSELTQWPVQLKLVPVNAPYFDGANLLVAADCSAFAYAGFHEDFIRNHITVIGCPKLDAGDYTEKLTAIISENNIKSLTIVRMEVPCCGGLSHAATEALRASGKFIPWQVVTISVDGKRLQ
jgi:ferredoxin